MLLFIVSLHCSEDNGALYTGSQPWTVDASAGNVYVITNEKELGQQWLDTINAETGDITESIRLGSVVRGDGHIGGLALL